MKNNVFCVSKKLFISVSILLLIVFIFFAVGVLNKNKITKNSKASIFNCLGAGYKKTENTYVYKNQSCCGNKTTGAICFEPAGLNITALSIGNYGVLNCATEELALQKTSCYKKAFTNKPTTIKTPTPSPKTNTNNIVNCDLSKNSNNREPRFWIKECCSVKDIFTGVNKCVLSTYDVVKDNNISSDAYLAQYVLDCKKNEYYECGGRASCALDQNSSKLKCDGLSAGPYSIPTPESKVMTNFEVVDENNYIITIQDGERTYKVKLDMNPDITLCSQTLSSFVIKDKGVILSSSAIVPEYQNNNLFIKVVDTAYIDVTYVERSKEIFRQKLKYSELWSMYETKYDKFNGILCVKK